jgi:hypothetical protein
MAIHPSNSSTQLARPWTLLWAHDAQSRACDLLLGELLRQARQDRGPGHVEEIGSLEAAWVALDRAGGLVRSGARQTEDVLVLVCLDLPPVPRGGMTVTGWARSLRMPAIMVTHGRRWLPPGAATDLPTLSPAASREEVARALAMSAVDAAIESPPESFPGRPSWLG